MKRSVLYFCFCFLVFQSNAQLNIGVTGGVNVSDIHTGTNFNFDPIKSYYLGLSSEFDKPKYFDLELDLLYSRKGYSRTPFGLVVGKQKWIFHYVDLQGILKIKIIERLKLLGGLGTGLELGLTIIPDDSRISIDGGHIDFYTLAGIEIGVNEYVKIPVKYSFTHTKENQFRVLQLGLLIFFNR